MTYPTAPLGVRMRAVLTTFDATAAPSSWTWTDVTSTVLHMAPITDSIGAADDDSDTNSSLTFTLKNDDGTATTDNPASPWWPYFDVGTPIEYSLDVGDGGGWDVQIIAYVTKVTIRYPSGTPYRCLADVECAGYFARGNSAQTPPVRSPLLRTVTSTRRKAVWPLETGPSNALPGGNAMVGYGGHPLLNFGAQTLVPGLAAMATTQSGQSMIGHLPTPTTAASVRLSCVFYVSQVPAANQALLSIFAGRGGNRYQVQLAPAGLQFQCYNANSVEISGAPAVGFAAHLSGPVWLDLDLSQSGSNINYTMTETSWSIDPNTGLSVPNAGGFSGSFAGTLGGMTDVVISEFGDAANVTIGMVVLTEAPLPALGGFAAVTGWAGNTAAARVSGLSTEYGIPSSVANTGYGVIMGPQLVDTYEANMRDVAHADHGVLSDHLGMTTYRTAFELYNAAPVLTLTRGVRGQLPKDVGGVRDDSAKANRVTLQRPDGGSATLEDADDILAHGTYERSPDSANLASDYQLIAAAGWYLARGVATGMRHDAFRLNMRVAAENTAGLAGSVASLQLGDRIAVLPPPQFVQNTIERQVRGRSQTVINRGYKEWTVEYQVVPTDAYEAFQLDIDRLDTSGTEVILAAGTTDTTLITETAGALPTVGSGLSIPLWAAGERVTLTAVATEAAADAFSGTATNSWGSFPATSHLAATAYQYGGTLTNFQRTGSAGTIAVPSAGLAQYAVLGGPYAMTDVDLTAYCTVPVLATGAALEVELGWRRNVSANNQYSARLSIQPSAAVTLQFYAPANSTPLVDMDTSMTHTAGATYGITVRTIGTRHQVFVWQGTTTAGRANNPHVDLDDTTRVISGSAYFRNGRSSGNTNAGTVTFSWTNISFNNLQALTATRSVNGVVKSLPAQSKIRLWDSRGMGV